MTWTERAAWGLVLLMLWMRTIAADDESYRTRKYVQDALIRIEAKLFVQDERLDTLAHRQPHRQPWWKPWR